ncbi:hypothetical protein BS78_02G009300 [Paspalum vaginatum]|nr:hypothetical protein BS78_02G009300 [Paspalum vaginatum]
MEVVEDLSFLQGGGGGPGRKKRRVLEWRYGERDHLGERRERGRPADREERHWRRDDDDDFDDISRRRHRSRSVWDRVSQCRGEVADCYSSSRFHGRGNRDSTPYRRRAVQDVAGAGAWGQGAQATGPKKVWRQKKKSATKSVSFAEPLVEILGEGVSAVGEATDGMFVKEARIREMLQAGNAW